MPHTDNVIAILARAPVPQPPTPAMVQGALNWNKTPIEVLAARHPNLAIQGILDQGQLEQEIEIIKQALIAAGYDNVDALRGLHHVAMSSLASKLGSFADTFGISGHRCEAELVGRPKDQNVKITLVARSPNDAAKITRMKSFLTGL